MTRFGSSDGVAICSGGMDSVTLVYKLVAQNKHPHLVSFDYGQRHKKELQYAENIAEGLGLRWSLIDLTSLTELISNSALTYGAPVPEGYYSADNMALTVVPNRNMTMLSIAAAIAVNYKYYYVAAGMHAGDHAQYPDCREQFLMACENAILEGNAGFIRGNFRFEIPFLYKSKNDIAAEAFRLKVPLYLTWSCYKGGSNHCGRCGTCVERLEAIHSVADAPDNWDQTVYDDPDYWRQAKAEYEASK